jgi:hypothetical protein
VESTEGNAPARTRHDVALEWLAKLDPDGERWADDLAPVSMAITDAVIHTDATFLRDIREPLRDSLADLFHGTHAAEARGYLVALLAMTRWGLERLPEPASVEIPPESYAWKLLEVLHAAAEPRSSGELKARLKTSDSQVSRSGRQLLAQGLVNQRRAGRTAVWELTPRGRQVLDRRHGRRSSAG